MTLARTPSRPRTLLMSDWRNDFLDDLRRSGSVQVAAGLNNISTAAALAERKTNPEFAALWELAIAGTPSHLTEADMAVLDQIDGYIRQHGNSPTLRSIARWLGKPAIGSTTTRWLERMRANQEIVVTEEGAGMKFRLAWTRPWVLALLAGSTSEPALEHTTERASKHTPEGALQ